MFGKSVLYVGHPNLIKRFIAEKQCLRPSWWAGLKMSRKVWVKTSLEEQLLPDWRRMRSNPSSALQMGNKWKPESVKALNLLSEAWLHWWRGRGEDESLTRCSGMMWRCTETGMWLNCENPANKQEKQDELLNHTFTVSHSGMSTQFPAWLLFLNSLSESSFLNTYAVHSVILPQHGRWRVFSAIGFCCSLLAHNLHCGLSGMPDLWWILQCLCYL